MIDLKLYGYEETEPEKSNNIPGRVTEQQRDKYTVMTEHGEVTASLKGTFHHNVQTREGFPCVGDFVLLQYNPTGDSRITELLPRKSKFSRADFSGHAVGYVKTIREQVVAANFDYVFILSSLNADFRVSRILRYLTQAWQSGGQPVVILTKADLAWDYDSAVMELQQVAADVPVHAISSHTGQGLDVLGQYLQPGKAIVFLGMSGVGKSSLLNVLMSEDVMAVNSIREDDSRGRHTTTHRQLFMLPCGAMVIDTPGMRELGLFDVGEAISQGFSDIEELFTQCKFSDCQHKTEPRCAIRAALSDGSLPQERWERYQAQMRENRFVDRKAARNLKKKG
ncbi:MAG: ribosome small subunit-dependent GTPase A [Defluviitaleaceae bacterium]|nr:ribosome small subunit-dependent GTPase A [Defluviitaleaceae bacterium]